MPATSATEPEPRFDLLLVEDNPEDAEFAQELLTESAGALARVRWVQSLREAIAQVAQHAFDLVMLDLGLPDSHGLESLDAVLKTKPGIAVVVVTGLRDEATGVLAVQRGAQDFVAKANLNTVGLWHSIRYAVERARLLKLLAAQADLLQLQNRELQEFAQVLSHDLRAPARATVNYARFLEEDVGKNLNGEAVEMIRAIRSNGLRMSHMIEAVLECASLGRASRDVCPVVVEEVLRDVVRAVKPPPGFRVETSGKFPVLVTSRTKISRVFQNLIGNAVQHHDRPVGCVRVTAEDFGNRVAFVVEDDGPGVPEERRPGLFDLSSGQDMAAATRTSGLGLYIVRRLVEGEGGEVCLLPGQGRGSRFRFTWANRENPMASGHPGDVERPETATLLQPPP